MYSRNQLAYQAGVLCAYRSLKASGAILSRISKILNPVKDDFETNLPEGWTYYNLFGSPTSGVLNLQIGAEFDKQNETPNDITPEIVDNINSVTTDLFEAMKETIEGLGFVIIEAKPFKIKKIAGFSISFRYPYGVTDSKPVYDALYRILKSPLHDVYQDSNRLEVYLACWDTATIKSDLSKLAKWAEKNGFAVEGGDIKEEQWNVNYIKARDQWIKDNLDKFEITDSGKGYDVFTLYVCSAYLTQ